MELTIILIFYGMVIIFDFIPLLKTGKIRQGWVYLGALIISFSILLLNAFHVDVPSPTNAIRGIMDTIGNLF